METINKHVSKLRGLINQFSDDSDFTDQYLYSLLKDARAILLKRKAMKFHKISDWNWQRYCIGLEQATSHNCDCIEDGCIVLKSCNTLPKPLIGRNNEFIKIESLDGKVLPRMTENEYRFSQLDDIKKDCAGWDIDGVNKLVIFGELNWKVIQVSMISEDPAEWTGLSFCDVNGDEVSPCFSVTDSEFPIEADLVLAMYELVVAQLNVKLQVPDDITNDANDDIKN
jgi:hypothetical protein